nr:4Fe-4S binding protein [uncultured Rhodoferax sp.]
MNTANGVDAAMGLTGLTPLPNGAHHSPEVVVFESLGCVLVLGDDASAGDVAQRVAQHQPTVVFAAGVDTREWGHRITAVGRKVTHLHGHMGAFQAEIHVGNDVTDIGVSSRNSSRYFDLVLDLGAQALITDEVKPYGYFSPGRDAAKLAQALVALRTLVGKFAQPRYLSYLPALCAHGASGLTGCSRCLSVCATQAIRCAGNSVKVDPFLCQGCASCAVSCPTGALSLKTSDRQALHDRIQAALASSGKGAALIVHATTLNKQTLLALSNHQVARLQVAPLPALGDELWLRALALGARVLILLDDALPEKTRSLLLDRLGQAQTVLTALGQNPERLAFLKPEALTEYLQKHPRAIPAAATPSAVATLKSWAKFKRIAWVDSLRLMGGDLRANPQMLPTGAPMGSVQVDAKRCTLCFACVNVCPTRALLDRHESTLQLVFQESACVQCGLCVKACPEQVLSLQARIAPEVFAHMTTEVVHQDEPISCTSCKAPFISRQLLESSLKRLQDHPVMAQGGRQTLMTCPACRQREMLAV